jgi:hypothetical protein
MELSRYVGFVTGRPMKLRATVCRLVPVSSAPIWKPQAALSPVHFVTTAEKRSRGNGRRTVRIALNDAYRHGAGIFDSDIFGFLKSGFIADEKWQQDRGECLVYILAILMVVLTVLLATAFLP